MEELEKKWEEILQKVKEEHDVTDVSFDTWIKPLKVYAVQDGCVYVVWDSEQLGLSYLTKKYMLPLKMAIAEVTGEEYEVKFMLPEHAEKMAASYMEGASKEALVEEVADTQMDIYKFINSKDMAEHLKSLEYGFSLPEAAFLVYQSEYRTLEEKCAAWQELINTMPDCAAAGNMGRMAVESFHQFLRDYMALQKKLLQMFCDSEEFVYTYEIYIVGTHENAMSESEIENPEPCWIGIEKYFTNPEVAFAYFKREKKVHLEDGAQRVRFIKKPLINEADPERHGEICVVMTMNLEVITIDIYGVGTLNEEEMILFNQFDNMWFAFPTPFKRGDIVIDRSSYAHMDEPFVLDAISTWDKETMLENGFPAQHPRVRSHEEAINFLQEYGDQSDMSYAAFYLDKECEGFPTLYHDNGWTYLNLERYKEPLQGMDRVLKAVSSAMTYDSEYGEPSIEPELLCNAYQLIVCEEMCKANRAFLEGCYPEEWQEGAGLKQDDKEENSNGRRSDQKNDTE